MRLGDVGDVLNHDVGESGDVAEARRAHGHLEELAARGGGVEAMGDVDAPRRVGLEVGEPEVARFLGRAEPALLGWDDGQLRAQAAAVGKPPIGDAVR